MPHLRDSFIVAKVGIAQERDRPLPTKPQPPQTPTIPNTDIAPPSPLHDHLLHLEQQLLNPITRARPEAVAALLTGDFHEVGSSGRIYTKADILEALANEPPTTLHLTDFACQPLSPEIALVTYRSHRSEAAPTISALRSSLWLRRPSGWQLHFHQGTRT